MNNNLPQGWAVTPISSLTSHNSGNSKLIKGKLHQCPGNNLYPAYSASGQDIWHSSYEKEGKAIIVSAVGARCGKCFKADGKWSAIANTHIVWPNPNLIDRDYLWYQLNNENYWVKGGSAQPFVKTGDTFKKNFKLPPLNEQRRIVSKIEELLSDLDVGEASLKKARQLIASYRQAIFKEAFSPNDSWKKGKVGDFLSDIRYGTAKKCGRDGSKTPVLRIPNVIGGFIDLSDLKYADFNEKELKALALKSGDILIVRSNGSVSLVGLSALVTENCENCLYAGYLIRLRVKQDQIFPKFLNYYLHSPIVRSLVSLQAKSTSGVHNINSDEIKSIPISFPTDIEEQLQITDKLETALSQIDGITHWYEREEKRLVSLRQSILKQAFEGNLVPQDPADEPASELLKRTSTQSSQPKAARGRKQKAAG